MAVTHNGGTFLRESVATDGVPFITASQCATLVSMPPILVADQPSIIGETVLVGHSSSDPELHWQWRQK